MAELAEPRWIDVPAQCISCGYSLAGLPIIEAREGLCPECGAGYQTNQLVLEGVPNRLGGSPRRRLAWIALLVFTLVFMQLITIWLMFARYVIVPGVVLIAGGFGWLVLSSPRELRGVERFIIGPHGIARVPITIPKGAIKVDTLVIPWSADLRFSVKQAGPFWTTVRIWDQRHRRVFDAGFRSSAETLPRVVGEIDGFIRAAQPKPGPTDTQALPTAP